MTSSCIIFKAGTRNSPLAVAQAGDTLRLLERWLPGVRCEMVPSESPGDRDRQTDLRASPADFFTRDLDEAVLAGRLDLAVHSAKDLPEPLPAGLDFCWLPWREDPRDALILAPGKTLADLPPDAVVGISSDRREAYCHHFFPGFRPRPIRGNIEHRLAQLDAGAYDVVIMAGAALNRLGLQQRITQWIPLSDLPVPAGQGVLAMTFRAGDPRLLRLRSLLCKAVTFVSAGPGNSGLCTVAGATALGAAEVCLFDALSDPALLQQLPATAVAIDVGKRCGAHTQSQTEINDLLALHARRGQRVVRLKGGDSGMFGRLAEEVETLEALRLPYRVIPGVSSLNAASTGTGMLLTRRGVARGFTAMTPRKEGGGIGDVSARERQRLPLLFFMAIQAVPEVVAQLLAEGRPADEPCAVVFNAGSNDECVCRATLSTLADELATHGSSAPGLLLVGEVTRHGYARDAGALGGRRVLLTCSAAIMPKAIQAVLDFGGIPVASPLIRLETAPELSPVLQNLRAFDWLVLTSPAAVRCFMEAITAAAVDLRAIPKLLVCGPGTAAELARFNLFAECAPAADFSADGMLRAAATAVRHGERILRLGSNQADETVATGLRALGAEVVEQVLYHNVATVPETLPRFDAIFFASSSAVSAFFSRWSLAELVGKPVVTIGKPTGVTLQENGLHDFSVSPAATVDAAIGQLAANLVAAELGKLFTKS